MTRKAIFPIVIFNIGVFTSAVAVFTLFSGHTARLITDLYPPVLAAMGVVLVLQIYRSLEKGRQARRIWGVMALAMGFWTLAEITWALYDYVLQEEPYPSWADLFYQIGDFFLVIFFALQFRFLRLALRGWKRILTIALILVYSGIVVAFVYVPMFAEPYRDWLEFGTNLLYETQYLLLLIGATALTLAVYEGFLGRRWVILAAGFWAYALANQIFFYANWHDLYYPNDQATPLSIAFDLLYIASYQIILTGLYLRHILPFPPVQVEDVLVSLPSDRPAETWVLLSDESGRASFVDPRLLAVLGATDVGRFTGEFVGATLGLRTNLDDQILQEVRNRGYSSPRKVLLAGRFYALQAIKEKRGLPEVYWLLTPWDARPDIGPEEQPDLEALMAQAVRGTARTASPEARIRAYFQAAFGLISLLCARFGGPEVGQQFTRQFGPTATACEDALASGQAAGIEACRTLLRQALEYALIVAPTDQVQGALARLEARLGEDILRAADAAGLRLRLS